MTYFTGASIDGPLRCIPIPWVIGITASPRDHTLIGVASEVGRTNDQTALWSLTIHGNPVYGLFIVDEGRFVPVELAAV
jgi:hypothetical protein